MLRVINSNNTIPVVVLDRHGQVQAYRNIDIDHCDNAADTTAFLAQLGRHLLAANRNIRIALDDDRSNDYIDVCYDDSLMLRRLSSYPYIQLGVVMLFVVIAIFALLTSKRAEQNKVCLLYTSDAADE